MNSFGSPDVFVTNKARSLNRLALRAASTARFKKTARFKGLRALPQLLLFLCLAISAHAASAATLYWDADGNATGNSTTTGAGLGGTGTWDTTSAKWFNGTTDVVWPNTGSDIAVFSGTAGTVTVSTGIQTNGVTFSKLAVTATTTGTAAGNANTLTVASPTNIVAGQFVTGTGIQPFTTVNSISGSVVTLSANTTAALSATTVNFYTPYTIAPATGAILTFTGTTPNAIPIIQSDAATDFGLITAPLAGTAGLLKTGIGPVSLNAANTFSGGFTLRDGTVSYNNATSFGAAANTINVGDATAPLITGGLVIRPNASVTLANNINFNRNVTFSGTSTSAIGGATQVINIFGNVFGNNTGTITITNLEGSQASTSSTSLTIGSVAGGVIQSGGGTSRLVLTGPSAYATTNNATTPATTTGGTAATIQDGTGTLGLTFNSTLGGSVLQATTTVYPVRILPLLATNTFTGGLTLQAGEVNFATNSNLGDTTKPITFTGGGLQFATGNTIDISTVRTLVLPGGNAIIDTNGNNLTFMTAISGAGGLSKQGQGTLTLPIANSYSGNTVVGSSLRNSGILLITNSGALGTGIVQLNKQLTFNGVLQLSGGLTVANAFQSSSSNLTTATAAPGQVGIESLDGNNTLSGSISLTSTGGTGIIFQSDAGSTLTLSNTLSITGSTITSGRSNQFLGAGDIVVSGAIKDGTNSGQNLGIQKDGSGKLTLTGTNTNTGTVLINAGTVQVGSSVAGGGSTGTLGATPSNGLLTNNGTLIFNRSGALAVNSPITGSGSITQSGSGTTTLSGIGTYSGGTTITGGVLVNNTSVSVAASSQNGYLPAVRTGTLANSSTSVTNVSDVTGLAVGQGVSGSGITAGSTIAAISGTTITLSTATSSSAAGTGVVLTFNTSGNSNNSTTITGLTNTSGLVIGQLVSGAGIPAGTAIKTIVSATSITVSNNVNNPNGPGTTSVTFGAGSSVPTGSNMTLAGGTFNTGGKSLSLGTLNLSDATTSGLDLGSSQTSVLRYSALGTGTGTVRVSNYNGGTTGGDQLFVGTTDVAAVSQFRFLNPNGQNGVFSAMVSGNNNGEIVPNIAAGSALVNLINGASISPTQPTLSTNEDTELRLVSGNSNVLSIADTDTSSSGILRVTLRPRNGRIRFNTSTMPGLTPAGTSDLSGITFQSGSSETGSVVKIISGSLSALNAALQDVSFIPVGDFNSSSNPNSPASLTITSDDGGASGGGGVDTDVLTIQVNAVNDAPVARPDAYSLASGATVLNVGAPQGLLRNDSDVDGPGPLQVNDEDTAIAGVQPVTQPSNGTLVLNNSGNGSFSYTPTASGPYTDSFTYRSTDGALGSNITTVTITVPASSGSSSSDVTSQVTVTQGGLTYSRSLRHYFQTVRLTNNTSTALNGPISLVLDGLTGGVNLVNADGTTNAPSGSSPATSPYVQALASSQMLAAGSTVSVTLEFDNPNDAFIDYTPRVLAGGTPTAPSP